MKKLFARLLPLLSCSLAWALPVGNPQDPALLTKGIYFQPCCGVSGRLGFYGDYVFNRHLQVNEEALSLHKDIEETKLYTNAALLTVNICSRFDLFGTIGETKCYIHTNFNAFSPGSGFSPKGQHIEIVTDFHLSGSIGARGIMGCWGPLSFGAEGQYFRTTPQVTRVIAYTDSGNYPSDVYMKYSEWQIGIGAAYNYDDFVYPYAAVKWAHCFADFGEAVLTFDSPDETVTLHDLKYNRTWGYAVGLNCVLCDILSFGVEGRFGAERALYINGQVRF